MCRGCEVQKVSRSESMFFYLCMLKLRISVRQLNQTTAPHPRGPPAAVHSNLMNMSQSSSAGFMNGASQIDSIRAYSAQSTATTRNSSSNPGLSNIEDEERNGLDIAAAALGQPRRIGEVPFYTGKDCIARMFSIII